jgi:hypothetical protein
MADFFFADHRATVFTHQKLSKQRKFFFANFCHEIGCENDQTYIFIKESGSFRPDDLFAPGHFAPGRFAPESESIRPEK